MRSVSTEIIQEEALNSSCPGPAKAPSAILVMLCSCVRVLTNDTTHGPYMVSHLGPTDGRTIVRTDGGTGLGRPQPAATRQGPAYPYVRTCTYAPNARTADRSAYIHDGRHKVQWWDVTCGIEQPGRLLAACGAAV